VQVSVNVVGLPCSGAAYAAAKPVRAVEEVGETWPFLANLARPAPRHGNRRHETRFPRQDRVRRTLARLEPACPTGSPV